MHVVALLRVIRHDTDINAVLHDRIPLLEIDQSYLVANGDIVPGCALCRRVVLGDDTHHFGVGSKALYDDNADVIFTGMDEKMRDL